MNGILPVSFVRSLVLCKAASTLGDIVVRPYSESTVEMLATGRHWAARGLWSGSVPFPFSMTAEVAAALLQEYRRHHTPHLELFENPDRLSLTATSTRGLKHNASFEVSRDVQTRFSDKLYGYLKTCSDQYPMAPGLNALLVAEIMTAFISAEKVRGCDEAPVTVGVKVMPSSLKLDPVMFERNVTNLHCLQALLMPMTGW